MLDTLRADRLGAYGSTRGLTPFLDELAARGVVFENAYATSSWTSPSIASLFTSRHPLQHGIVGFESVLGDGEATLAESLRALGFTSGGFSANFRIAEKLGYGQGFDVWRAYLESPDERDAGPKVPARFVREAGAGLAATASGIARRRVRSSCTCTSWSPTLPTIRRSRCASAWFRAPAARRSTPPTPCWWGFASAISRTQQVALLAALYDAEVATLDAELRMLFDALDANGFLEHSIVVVAADHGEEFREHGMLLHGITLFEPGVRVPLLLLGPGPRSGAQGRAAGLAARRGADHPGSARRPRAGALRRAFAPAADAQFAGERAGSEGHPSRARPQARRPRRCARTAAAWCAASRKLLVDPQGRPRVFDLARDPAELAASGTADEVRELVAALERERADLASRAPALPVPAAPLDAETRKNLRALGYLPGE